MPIHNHRKHRYEHFYGAFEGQTWIKEREDSSFCVRFNGRYTSNIEVLGYRRQFDYTLQTKQWFSSMEEAESYLERLTEREIKVAMSKAKKAHLGNMFELDSTFAVF